MATGVTFNVISYHVHTTTVQHSAVLYCTNTKTVVVSWTFCFSFGSKSTGPGPVPVGGNTWYKFGCLFCLAVSLESPSSGTYHSVATPLACCWSHDNTTWYMQVILWVVLVI